MGEGQGWRRKTEVETPGGRMGVGGGNRVACYIDIQHVANVYT